MQLHRAVAFCSVAQPTTAPESLHTQVVVVKIEAIEISQMNKRPGTKVTVYIQYICVFVHTLDLVGGAGTE